MAVVDLLDELREHIWAKYELKLRHAYRHEFAEQDSDTTEPFVDDEL